MIKLIRTILFIGVFSFGLLSAANATLESRLGGKAYYDTELNITWLANASMNGPGNWGYQNTWASGLTIGGVSGWRLPSADVNGDNTVVNCSGGGIADCSDNEMGFLFWEEGVTAVTPGVFSNVQSYHYWSGTELVFFPGNAWDFHFGYGNQDANNLNNFFFAWAVYDGDVGVSPVPEPEMYAILSFGLLVIFCFGRLRQQS